MHDVCMCDAVVCRQLFVMYVRVYVHASIDVTEAKHTYMSLYMAKFAIMIGGAFKFRLCVMTIC